MKTAKTSIIAALLLVVLGWTLPAAIAHCQTTGLVAVVEVSLNSGLVEIQKTTIQNGVAKSANTDKTATKLPYLAEMVDEQGRTLFSKRFDFIRYRTIPAPLDMDGFNPEDAVIPIDSPKAALVLPYYEDATTILIKQTNGNFMASIALAKAENKINPMPKTTPAESGKLNILVMASGFRQDEMDSFNDSAQAVINELKGLAPFSQYENNINYNTFKNTQDLGCAPGCYGIDRLLCCDQGKVISAALAAGSAVNEIIVIHNTLTYSGGGYRDPSDDYYKTDSLNSFSAVYKGCLMLPSIATHEFGHSFGNLCDEYSYGSEGYTYQYCVNCRPGCSDFDGLQQNCTQGCDAKSDYFRPEPSIMLNYSQNYFNRPSIELSLAPRLGYYIPTGPDQKATLPIHRFTHKGWGSYLFTNSTGEKDFIQSNLNEIYGYDGIRFKCFQEQTANSTPLFRLYNKINGTHFFTALKSDKDWIMENLSQFYDDEGIMCHVQTSTSSTNIPVYRIYQSCNSFHWYTASQPEKNDLLSAPCTKDEGIGFFAFPVQ